VVGGWSAAPRTICADGTAAGAAGGSNTGGKKDDVVDAEFEEVKDKDRKAS